MAQVVLILVGLIGSGKSTFAQALEQHLPTSFRRCNQDDLGDRRSVETLARQTLELGLSACIDRTNFDARQRAHWIKIARDFSVPVWVLVFDTPVQVCLERLRTREHRITAMSVSTNHIAQSIQRYRTSNNKRIRPGHQGFKSFPFQVSTPSTKRRVRQDFVPEAIAPSIIPLVAG